MYRVKQAILIYPFRQAQKVKRECIPLIMTVHPATITQFSYADI